jgi:proton-translocating NADH-quinone oxidoreductase chain L
MFIFGNKIGVRGAWIFMLMGNAVVVISIYEIIFFIDFFPGNIFISFDYGDWIIFSSFSANFMFTFDIQTLLISQLVTIVSFITQIYSYYYIANEPIKIRFQAYLNLFTFFMLVLVNSSNLLLFFIGWEGVGLCSYLLIGFWGNRPIANFAALKAVAINRVGDICYMLALSLIISFVGVNDFGTIPFIIPFIKKKIILFPFNTVITLLDLTGWLFAIAAFVKSAQFGFHGWLADAIEGPTPVSALIHAATMVTAGIYLILKISFIISESETIIKFIGIIGAFTSFFGASVAFFQWDIKKIIAYSTCSQLGYIFCSFGSGGITQSFFHLLTHGYFKALLFFTAGIVIHNLEGEQDIRKIGSIYQFMPLCKSFFFIGLTSLIGFPGIAGFYSKESIFDVILSKSDNDRFANYCIFFMLTALFFTVLYSIKIIYYVFYSPYNGNKPIFKKISIRRKELNFFTIVALTPLIIQAIFAEEILGAYFIDINGFALAPSSVYQSTNANLLKESISSQGRYLPSLTIFLAIFFFFKIKLYKQNSIIKKEASNPIKYSIFWTKFFQTGWSLDKVIINWFFKYFNKIIKVFANIEKFWGELFIPRIVEITIIKWVKKISSFTVYQSLNNFFISITLIIIILIIII